MSTITLLPSPAGPSGVFDASKPKMPPDGLWDCVRGGPQYSLGFSPGAPPHAHSASPHNWGPASPIYMARAQSIHSNPSPSSYSISTPPLTPDGIDSPHSVSTKAHNPRQDSLNFLTTLFPYHGAQMLPHAKHVSVAAPHTGNACQGVVLQQPGYQGHPCRTLYVDSACGSLLNLKDSVVALMDLATETLACSSLVIVLEKDSPRLNEILHAMMYVGGAIIAKPPFAVNPNKLLVGLELQ